VHFKTHELVLSSVAAFLRLQHCPKPDNPLDNPLGELGPLTIIDDLLKLEMVKTYSYKNSASDSSHFDEKLSLVVQTALYVWAQ